MLAAVRQKMRAEQAVFDSFFCRRALLLLALAACARATVPTAPPAASALPRPAPRTAEDDERDWHWTKPAVVIGDEKQRRDPRPMYPWVNPIVASECTVHVNKDNSAFYTCGASVARFDRARLDFDSFRDAPFGNNLPVAVFGSWPDDLWVRVEPIVGMYDKPVPDASDAFLWLSARHVHFRAGKATEYPTMQPPTEYRTGYLLFDLPRIDKPIDTKVPGCADWSCGNLLPMFWADGVEGPDFKSLKGKIAWSHERQELDWGYAIDKTGPVYVFMRALDLASKRRVFGIARWAPGGVAHFDVLPAPLSSGDARAWLYAGTAEGGRATFEPTIYDGKNSSQWIVRFDGRTWSASRKPAPPPAPASSREQVDAVQDGPELYGYRVNYKNMLEVHAQDGTFAVVATSNGETYGGALVKLGPSDLAFTDGSRLFRTSQPDEVLALTDSWGKLHPWPKEATAECDHPFVIIDVLEHQVFYDKLMQLAKTNEKAKWGKLPARFASVPLVETHVVGVIVVGASFRTMDDAKVFEAEMRDTRTDWKVDGFGNTRGGQGIYCVRPVAPKPFSIR